MCVCEGGGGGRGGGETAFHYCSGDMAVRMRKVPGKVLAIPQSCIV